MSDVIMGICDWNKDRDNTEFKGDLAFAMLSEELDEFLMAGAKTLTDKFGELSEEEVKERAEELEEYITSEEAEVDHTVNMLDALGDLIFVAVGEMYKLTGHYQKVDDVLLAITAANNLKSKEKNADGKITKPKNFQSPEPMIRRILLEEVS